MDAIFALIALLIATTLAGAFAFALHWLLLRAAFALMRPAAAAKPTLASPSRLASRVRRAPTRGIAA